MVTKQWLLQFANVVYDEDGTEYVELPSGNIIEVDVFLKHFEGAETYDNLISIDINEDGTTKGYKPLFDKWKAEGLIE